MKKKVLLVDDAAFMRMMLKKILEELDFEVIAEAKSGKEAVRFYNQYKPDLVTMDLSMPEMDGIKATEKIIAKDTEAKIIICSALGQKRKIIESVKAGAKDFILKPFDKESISRKIKSLVDTDQHYIKKEA
ncbi:MAG: response regulator [Halanaerobium sp.]